MLGLKVTEVQTSEITTAAIYQLGERSAPEGQEFLRGLAYWLSIDNHLFFVKTHAIESEQIKSCLDWLVTSGPDVLPQGSKCSLNAEFDPSHAGGDIGEIRSLRVKGKSAPQLRVSAPEPATSLPGRTVTRSREIASRFIEHAQALPVVQALLGPDRTQSLVSSLGSGEYLAVDAAVKVRGKRTEESRQAMKNIANDLADLTDAEVQVEGKDGVIRKGDAILRTKMPFDLPYEGSNLLEFDNVASQLQEVYQRFVKDGKIKA